MPYEFVCECANADCTFRLPLALQTYEAIRADPKQFVVLPQHYTPEVNTSLPRKMPTRVVRKVGEAGADVERLNPRDRSRSTPSIVAALAVARVAAARHAMAHRRLRRERSYAAARFGGRRRR